MNWTGEQGFILHSFIFLARLEKWKVLNFMERIKLRLERVEKFIEYLIKQEDEEFHDLGLSTSETKYSLNLKKAFDEEKKKILKSAKKKERLEAEYN